MNCTCTWEDGGDAETGPRPSISVRDYACPEHGLKATGASEVIGTEIPVSAYWANNPHSETAEEDRAEHQELLCAAFAVFGAVTLEGLEADAATLGPDEPWHYSQQ